MGVGGGLNMLPWDGLQLKDSSLLVGGRSCQAAGWLLRLSEQSIRVLYQVDLVGSNPGSAS